MGRTASHRKSAGFRNAYGRCLPVADALKRAAIEEACDFLGFGPHTLSRAISRNGKKSAGAALKPRRSLATPTQMMTEQYTVVGLGRQEKLTRLIQARRTLAAGARRWESHRDQPERVGSMGIQRRPRSRYRPCLLGLPSAPSVFLIDISHVW